MICVLSECWKHIKATVMIKRVLLSAPHQVLKVLVMRVSETSVFQTNMATVAHRSCNSSYVFNATRYLKSSSSSFFPWQIDHLTLMKM